MDQIRVRNLLSHMDALTRANLKKLLPPKLKAPETAPIRYPNALLSIFNKPDCYSNLGNVAEELLRLPVNEVTVEAACTAALKWDPTLTTQALDKVRVSKTTEPFLEHIRATRAQLDAIVKGPLRFDETVSYGAVQGHPDARTDTQLFEVKMTGQLQESWVGFLYQVFAYAALASEATDIYLVLPMQRLVWHYDVTTWTQRQSYRDLLNATATKRHANEANDAVSGALLRELCMIGCHVSKQKLLTDTMLQLPDRKPYQIFLGPPQSAKFSIADADLAGAAAVVAERQLNVFVHSPYIINLCQPPGTNDDYHTALLIKNLQYAVAVGFKGVVVHVGKSTTQDLPTALSNMATNLKTALAHATPSCPILLETPAGQGSETLTAYNDFVEFVLKFQDPRIRICVDTCHVFACGHQPIDYIGRLSTYHKKHKLVQLIHYNDSATPCGSRLDRHAYMGTGHIGMTGMTAIAHHCHDNSYPMLIE